MRSVAVRTATTRPNFTSIPGGRGLQPYPGPQLSGASGIGESGGRGVGMAGERLKGDGGAVVQVKTGGQLLRLLPADYAGIDANSLLHGYIAAESLLLPRSPAKTR